MIREAVVAHGRSSAIAKNRAELTDQSSQDVTKRTKPPKAECIQASGLDLFTITGKGEELDAQQWFSNLLHTGKTYGAFKTITGSILRDSNLIGMNEFWVCGFLKAPQLILICSKV